MDKVLVLGSDSRSFLAVVRSLGRRGLPVHVGWCPPAAFALRSKYIAKVHDIPAYAPDNEAWKSSLASLMRQESFRLTIPCDDPTLIPLYAHRNALEPLGAIALPNARAFEVAFDKLETHALAMSLGIPVPRGMVVTDPSEAAGVLDAFRLPVVLKPRATFTLSDLVNRNTVRRVDTPDELRLHLPALSARAAVLVQEHFPGTGVGVEVLASEGKILFAFQHVRIHEPLTGGGSSYRKSVPVHPELRAAAEKLMGALAYTGVAMVEFRMNPQTGAWVLVEINARFWGSLPLAVAAGADFPFYLYELLVRRRRDFPQGYATGLCCRNLWLDAVWMRANFRAWRSQPTLTRSPLQVAGEMVNFLTLRERSDTLVVDDPGPGVAELAYLTRAAWVRLLGRLLASALAVHPIRRYFARHALRALPQARSVLFVCKGNICRSPFAHHYALRIFPASVRVMSCGYYPREGRRCPREAVAVASGMAVDLAGHRSRIISEELSRQAQVIFVFDVEDYCTVLKRYPCAWGKLHLLGVLADGDDFVIRDPYGMSIDRFQAVYAIIARALDLLAAHITLRTGPATTAKHL